MNALWAGILVLYWGLITFNILIRLLMREEDGGFKGTFSPFLTVGIHLLIGWSIIQLAIR